MPFIIDMSIIKPIIDAAEARTIMPAAADGDPEMMLSREADRRDHIRHIRALRDHQRPLVDHAIVEFSRLVIVDVGSVDKPSAKALLELHHRIVVHIRLRECALEGQRRCHGQ